MPPRCPPLSLQVCPSTRYPTHRFQHPLPPTTPQQPSPSRISTSPHSPPCTPAHTTRTLLHTPHNGPTERAATLCFPPPPSPTCPSTRSFPTRMPPTLLAHNSTPPHPTCRRSCLLHPLFQLDQPRAQRCPLHAMVLYLHTAPRAAIRCSPAHSPPSHPPQSLGMNPSG